MHVKARSSNHDPNLVLDRDPKRLSERDSSPCEHSHCKQEEIDNPQIFHTVDLMITRNTKVDLTNFFGYLMVNFNKLTGQNS